MAGGSGTRFWPWSRKQTPKQLLALAGSKNMLADTASRLRKFARPDNVIVVTGSHLRTGVAKALPALPARNILCEPVGRNTAACVAWAALEVFDRDPDGVMAVLPADHILEPVGDFVDALQMALALADEERTLVTFGVKPTEPATGYGYIQARRALAGHFGSLGALSVDAFHEKPSARRARRFLSSGSYYWNSGMFAWRADVIVEEMERHLPGLVRALRRMQAKRTRGRVPQAVVDRAYPGLESISIDHGVMERAERVAMLPATFRWNDIGSWDAVADMWPSDAAGNRSRDKVVAVDSGGNVVATGGKPVALLGVNDLVVVDSGDALLVCRREDSQEVRKVVAALGPAGLDKLL